MKRIQEMRELWGLRGKEEGREDKRKESTKGESEASIYSPCYSRFHLYRTKPHTRLFNLYCSFQEPSTKRYQTLLHLLQFYLFPIPQNKLVQEDPSSQVQMDVYGRLNLHRVLEHAVCILRKTVQEPRQILETAGTPSKRNGCRL